MRTGGMEMFEKILLAVDESGSSARAVELAAGLASRFEGEVVVMEIPVVEHGPELTSETLGGDAPLVDRVVMDLKDSGISARPELWMAPQDEVGISVAHVVRAEGVDLIVIGEPAVDRLPSERRGSRSLPERLRFLTGRPTLVVP